MDNNFLRIHLKLFQDSVQNKTSFNLTKANGILSGLFSITSTGYVETLQDLDYEELPNQYTLNVTVTEEETGLSSTSQVNKAAVLFSLNIFIVIQALNKFSQFM